jgi:hypothetical protein
MNFHFFVVPSTKFCLTLANVVPFQEQTYAFADYTFSRLISLIYEV